MKISVIVPVFNGEKYLNRCVNSILNQTFTDFELILINDGSTDNSEEICLNFSVENSKIKFVSTENSGAAAARNRGIDESVGEYIVFIDCDDYVNEDYLEKLYCAVSENNADIAVCSMELTSESGNNCTPNIDNVYSKKEYIAACFLHKVDYVSAYGPCCKIISSKVIKENNIYFPSQFKLSEDRIFNLFLMDKIEKAVSLSYVGYYYVDNPASLTHNKNFFAVLKNILCAEAEFWNVAEMLVNRNNSDDNLYIIICEERRKAFLSMGCLITRLKSRNKNKLYKILFDISSYDSWNFNFLSGIKWNILKYAIKKKNILIVKLWLYFMEIKNNVK